MGDAASMIDVVEGDGPVVATAIHDGHALRPAIRAGMRLDDATRLREEDPFTGSLAAIAPTRLVVRCSRFEVDLNRPRATAVYAGPEHAWGLDVVSPSEAEVAISLARYDHFYGRLEQVLRRVEARHGRFVVLDLHSYNHRRAGPDGAVAPAATHPEINVGTRNIDRRRWAAVVDRFIVGLGAQQVAGHALDVRENVRFGGGELSRWVARTFPETGCVLAIELKKTFMDEWSGAVDRAHLDALRAALAATVEGLVETVSGAA